MRHLFNDNGQCTVCDSYYSQDKPGECECGEDCGDCGPDCIERTRVRDELGVDGSLAQDLIEDYGTADEACAAHASAEKSRGVCEACGSKGIVCRTPDGDDDEGRDIRPFLEGGEILTASGDARQGVRCQKCWDSDDAPAR